MSKARRTPGKRVFLIGLFFLLGIPMLSSCGRMRSTSGTGMYFDTIVDIRIFDRHGEALLQECFSLCEELEGILSAQQEGSELWNLNHRTEQTVTVSEDLANCIAAGLQYGDLSDGAFDITIFPLRELWNFEEASDIPSEEDLRQALAHVNYRAVHLQGNQVTFDDPETQIDLGGIAKGYISSKLKAYLQDAGCTSALLNLGGNVSALGTKPDGTSWVVGIQEPFAERGTIHETVELSGGSVISSGTYERYFIVDGVQYHHILDPHTGYPVVTDLQQATVIGEDDVRGDAFSTICILLGEEESRRIAATYEWNIELRFVYAS